MKNEAGYDWSFPVNIKLIFNLHLDTATYLNWYKMDTKVEHNFTDLIRLEYAALPREMGDSDG